MVTESIEFATIPELGTMIRDGTTSSLAVTELMLDRIGRSQESLNAFVTVTSALALEQAEVVDAELAKGIDRGPLHGVPIAVKDLFFTKGIRTTGGTKHYRDQVPDADASVMSRLYDAGVVMLGKTGLHELAWGSTSENAHYGAVSNPWNLDCHPGGSSGGSAAAVAAGLAYGALGTDTGCSVRQPAHVCGIVGHKPTFGLVSKAGVMPLVWSLDHVGPLTRSTYDAALLLQAIAGPDRNDPYSVHRPVGELLGGIDTDIGGLVIGIARDYFFEGGDGDVIELVDAALEVFANLGARVIDVALPGVSEAYTATGVTFAEAYAAHGHAFRENPEGFSAGIQDMFESVSQRPAWEYVLAQHYRAKFRAEVADVFNRCDVLVTPTSTVTTTPVDAQPTEHARERWKNTGIFNFTGSPSISLPCGFTGSGLPVGLMVTGRLFDDARVLNVAYAFEQATGWHRRHPTLDFL